MSCAMLVEVLICIKASRSAKSQAPFRSAHPATSYSARLLNWQEIVVLDLPHSVESALSAETIEIFGEK